MARPKDPAKIPRDAEIWARWNAGERSLAVLANDYKISSQRVGQVIASKDGEVYSAWRTAKYTLADLAEIYGLSSEDVTRIVMAKHPEQQDEIAGRAVMRSRVELLTLAIQEVIENPGYKVTAVGHVAEGPDGNPLVDTSAKIEAIKVQLNAFKQLAILNGDEKPQRSHITHDIAQQQADTWLADMRAKRETELRELEAYRRQGVIPGQVVRELEPGT